MRDYLRKRNIEKRKIISVFVTIIFTIALFVSYFNPIQAVFNKEINYQGKLTLASGVAVPNTSYSIVFSLYTVSTGGSAVWTETRSVPTSNGLFSEMLGSSQSLSSVDFNQTLYLGVKVGSDAEMTPRKKLGVVPASIEAEHSATAVKSTNLAGGNSTTLLGSIPYQSDTDTTAFVNPNTTIVKKFFTMIGTGTNGAAPTWVGILDADLPSALTSKTYNSLTITANGTNTLNIATGKTLTSSNSLTFSGTDGSTLNIGTGGTLGTAAYTSSTAYEAPLTFTSGLTRTVNSVANDLITGKTGGQTAIGGTGATDILKLQGTIGDGTLTSPAIQFLTGNNGGTVAINVLNNGNVGIGTVGPNYKLDITGSNISSETTASPLAVLYKRYNDTTLDNRGAGPSLLFSHGLTSASTNKSAEITSPSEDSLGYSRSVGLGFWTSATDASRAEVMRISSSGNVGIGTTGPTQKLVVVGTQTNVNQGAPATSGATSTAISRIQAGVGYGESLDMGLNVISGASYAWIQPTNYGNLANNFALSLNPNGGNVGIGTTAPGELLTLGTAGTTAGVLSLAGATSGKAIIQVGAVAGTPTLTLPTTTGTLALTTDISSAYVPYTGATTNVNLGTNTITSAGLITSGSVSQTTSITTGISNTITQTSGLGTHEFNGIRSMSTYNGTQNESSTYGIKARMDNTTDATVTNSGGIMGYLFNNNVNGTVTNGYGSVGGITNHSKFNKLTGMYSFVTNDNTDINNNDAYGFYTNLTNSGHFDGYALVDGDLYNTGSINSVNGMQVSYYGAGGTLGEIHGIDLGVAHNWTGTATSSYAIKIDPSTNIGTTTNYSIYSGSTADSYFAGNVGIGTVSPARKFVVKDTYPTVQLVSNTSGDTYTDGFQFRTINDDIYFSNFENTKMFFGNNQVDGQMTLDAIGNLGIGTTSPTQALSFDGTTAHTIWMERNTTAATAGQGLTLSSGGAIAGTADLEGGDLILKSGISTGIGSSAMRFFTTTASTTGTTDNNPTEKMTILGNGHVGIGTPTPGYLLDVNGVSRSQRNTGGTNTFSGIYRADAISSGDMTDGFGTGYYVYIQDNAGVSNLIASFGAIRDGSDSSGKILFDTNNNGTYGTKMVIDKTGNVGIGTTAPSEKLQVAGNILITGDEIKFINDDYGIGKIPGAGLAIHTWSGTAIQLGFGSIASFDPKVTIQSTTGNVGIGNTAPGYALHVGSSSVTDATVLLRLEDANSTCDFTANTGAPSCGSDETLKKNIEDQRNNLEKVLALRPVTYNWIADEEGITVMHGFIAQEVAGVMPELVTDSKWIDGTTKKFLQTAGMTPYIIGAIQEMNLKVENINNFEVDEEGNSIINSWRDALVAWFSNTANGINELVSGILRAKDKLCIGEGADEVCITKEELLQIKNNTGGMMGSAGNANIIGGDSVEEIPVIPPTEETPVIDSPTKSVPGVVEEVIPESTSEPKIIIEEATGTDPTI